MRIIKSKVQEMSPPLPKLPAGSCEPSWGKNEWIWRRSGQWIFEGKAAPTLIPPLIHLSSTVAEQRVKKVKSKVPKTDLRLFHMDFQSLSLHLETPESLGFIMGMLRDQSHGVLGTGSRELTECISFSVPGVEKGKLPFLMLDFSTNQTLNVFNGF